MGTGMRFFRGRLRRRPEGLAGVISVIQGCEWAPQLEAAERYAELWMRRAGAGIEAGARELLADIIREKRLAFEANGEERYSRGDSIRHEQRNKGLPNSKLPLLHGAYARHVSSPLVYARSLYAERHLGFGPLKGLAGVAQGDGEGR